MEKSSPIVGAAVTVVLAAGLIYGGWRAVQSEAHSSCDACGRPLHSHARVVGLVDGDKREFCCPACALTDHRQTGKTVEIQQLTDYAADRPLAPDQAFLVVGSSVNHCLRALSLMDDHKEVRRLDYDRCEPSVLAFAREQDARTFIAKNGGELVRFSKLKAQLR